MGFGVNKNRNVDLLSSIVHFILYRVDRMKFEVEETEWNSVIHKFKDNKREKRAWVRELINSIGNATLLSRYPDNTSLRQAFILLDNSIEQFMKSYLKYVKNEKIQTGIKFYDVIVLMKKRTRGTKNLLDRVLEYHETRNNLYHPPQYMTIAPDRFNDYIEEAIELGKRTLRYDISNFVENASQEFIGRIRETDINKRLRVDGQIQDMIRDEFRITPGEYVGDIILGCHSGNFYSATESFNIILQGCLQKEAIKGKKIRILELVDSNEENAFHTFFISYIGGKIWYCFYRCVWSKWGEGNRLPVKNFKEQIERYKKVIIYKKVVALKECFFGAFDPVHTSFMEK